jgi:hypothetical protein
MVKAAAARQRVAKGLRRADGRMKLLGGWSGGTGMLVCLTECYGTKNACADRTMGHLAPRNGRMAPRHSQEYFHPMRRLTLSGAIPCLISGCLTIIKYI